MKLLFTSPVSACFELENDAPYYAPVHYTVWLDGEKYMESDSNVFSLFSLRPATAYRLKVTGEGMEEELAFTTKAVTAGVNVKDFGALGDGVADDTVTIQAAIHCLPEGGLLHFPAGTYRTGPLALKSHITLSLGEGAVLLGDTDRSHYPVIPGELNDLFTGEPRVYGAWEGNAVPMCQALIFAEHARDITVVGPGTVDGNAQNSEFWTRFKEFAVARPRLFFFNRCENVTVHGVIAQNSASWQFHPFFSKQVGLYDISIKAPKNSPNTDAIDPEACDGVDIIGCRFSVGDDCIAIKSGKIDRGLRIKTRRGRGEDCVLNNILFENIRMEGVLTPVAINMWYNCCDPDRFSEYVWSREHLPVDERTPHLGKFTFRRLTCTDVEVAACYIDGLPEMPIDEVNFQDVSFTYAKDARPGKPIMKNYAQEECRLGLYLDNVRRISIKNVTLDGQAGERIVADHYESLEVE